MPGLLTGRELTQMRAQAAIALPDLCAIQTRSTAADGQGGVTITWANTYTNVPCRMAAQRPTSRERSLGGQFEAPTAWILTVRYNQTIASGNRVVFAGDTFEVLTVEDNQTYRILRRAYLRRID